MDKYCHGLYVRVPCPKRFCTILHTIYKYQATVYLVVFLNHSYDNRRDTMNIFNQQRDQSVEVACCLKDFFSHKSKSQNRFKYARDVQMPGITISIDICYAY